MLEITATSKEGRISFYGNVKVHFAAQHSKATNIGPLASFNSEPKSTPKEAVGGSADEPDVSEGS